MPPTTLQFETTITVQAPASRVLTAFVDPVDLAKWWGVVRSVTVPRPLGTFAVEWRDRDFGDEILGRLGGAFHGTIMEYRPGRELFVAEAYWNPPDGEPIGPMSLQVRCEAVDTLQATQLTVCQSGEDEGPRWQRYFQVIGAGWHTALADLKRYLEGEATGGPR